MRREAAVCVCLRRRNLTSRPGTSGARSSSRPRRYLKCDGHQHIGAPKLTGPTNKPACFTEDPVPIPEIGFASARGADAGFTGHHKTIIPEDPRRSFIAGWPTGRSRPARRPELRDLLPVHGMGCIGMHRPPMPTDGQDNQFLLLDFSSGL